MSKSETVPREQREDAPPDDDEVMAALGSSHSAVIDFDELLDTVSPDGEDGESTSRGATEEEASER